MILLIILTLRRCGSPAPHPTTLSQEKPFSKTLSLTFFTTIGKIKNFDELTSPPSQRGTATSSDNVEISDPCPEAREKLQEMCRHM